ncbi:unnamed protein product [Camellia sinensis]
MDAHSSGGDDFSVGCILSIKTTLGDEFEAQVITFDPPSNILVLQEGKSGSGQLRNIRLLKANYIESFKYLGQAEDPLDPKKFNLDLNSLQSREDSAIRQAEREVERIGVGVTAEAQSIFDALSKTEGMKERDEGEDPCSTDRVELTDFISIMGMLASWNVPGVDVLNPFDLVLNNLLPVRWDKTAIIVLNDVRVCSPYLPESVTGGTPAANDRVRKMLTLKGRDYKVVVVVSDGFQVGIVRLLGENKAL